MKVKSANIIIVVTSLILLMAITGVVGYKYYESRNTNNTSQNVVNNV